MRYKIYFYYIRISYRIIIIMFPSTEWDTTNCVVLEKTLRPGGFGGRWAEFEEGGGGAGMH